MSISGSAKNVRVFKFTTPFARVKILISVHPPKGDARVEVEMPPAESAIRLALDFNKAEVEFQFFDTLHDVVDRAVGVVFLEFFIE